MKKFIFTLLLIPTFLFAKNPEPKAVQWISFEKAIALNKTNPKPIIIDIYTDWCHWCKVMDKKTYSDPVIVNYINTNFYAVKFNAEQKESITYNKKTFKFVAYGKRGSHEFAASILKGKLSFPSTVFMSKKEELIQAIPGYLKKPMMEKLVNFMHQEAYLNTGWTEFEKNFKSKL